MNSAARAMLATMLVAGAVSATAVQCMAEEVPQYQLSFGTFVSPRDIKLGPAGHVYIADAGNSRVREYTHDGQFVRNLDSGSGPGAFGQALSCVVDDAGTIYVQSDNDTIKVFNVAQGYVRAFRSGGARAALDPGGQVLYVSTARDSILKYDATTGARMAGWQFFSGGHINPLSIGPSGAVYVTSTTNVQKYSASGQLLASWGELGTGAGQFVFAAGVSTDASENVYVMDSGNARVQKFTKDGVFVSSWSASANGISITADADHVFVLTSGPGRVDRYGYSVTATRRVSWGVLKQAYR